MSAGHDIQWPVIPGLPHGHIIGTLPMGLEENEGERKNWEVPHQKMLKNLYFIVKLLLSQYMRRVKQLINSGLYTFMLFWYHDDYKQFCRINNIFFSSHRESPKCSPIVRSSMMPKQHDNCFVRRDCSNSLYMITFSGEFKLPLV